MKYLIMAAGGSERWNNYLGIPKHLTPIWGEPLIHRTKRQFGPEAAIIAYDSRYGHFTIAPQPSENTPLPYTGLGHSYAFWSHVETTMVVFGDVVFSDSAVQTIKSFHEDHITFFGRADQNPQGHCRELYAIAIPPHCREQMLTAMKWTANNRIKLGQPHGGGWLVYARINKVKLGEDPIRKNFVQIDDGFTDDFDYPHQYEAWVIAHPKP